MLLEFERDATDKGLTVRLFQNEFFAQDDSRGKLLGEAYLCPVPPWFDGHHDYEVIRLNPVE